MKIKTLNIPTQRTLKFLLELTLLLFYPFPSSGQENLTFNQLTKEDGLPSNFAHCFVKDHQGFLWIGTDAGISRFDGINVVTYSHIFEDSTSLLNNNVNVLYADQLGHIWIATDEGLSIYYPEQSTFRNYKNIFLNQTKFTFGNSIKGLAEFNNKIWVLSKNALFNTGKEQLQFEIAWEDTINQDEARFLTLANRCIANSSGLWALTAQGPIFTPDGKSFHSKINNPERWTIFNQGFITALIQNGDSVVYYCTKKFAGIYKFNLQSNKLDSIQIPYEHNVFSKEFTHGLYTFLSISNVSNNKIWGTTLGGGAFCLDLKTYKTQFFPETIDSHAGPLLGAVRIITDEEGTVFINSFSGLKYFNPIKSTFKSYDLSTSYLKDSDFHICEGDSGNLWISTSNFNNNKSKILFSFNPTDYLLTPVNTPNYFKSIWCTENSKNGLLIATDEGLVLFNESTKTFSTLSDGSPIRCTNTFPLSKEAPPVKFEDFLKSMIAFVQEDEEGIIWLGSNSRGLLKYSHTLNEITFPFDFQINEYNPVPPRKYITAFHYDYKGNLWVGFDDNEIVRLGHKNEPFYKFTLPNKNESIGRITSIYRDSSENIWITTGLAGLFKFDLEKKTFKHYGISDGLASNTIWSLTVDQNRLVWITTPKGLNLFNPKTEQFTLVDIPGSSKAKNTEYSSLLKVRNGIIYIIGKNMITWFNPSELQLNPYLPKVVFLSYSKSGNQINVSSNENQFDFNYKDKVYTFNFGGINFIDPSKNKYAYTLEGNDDSWHYTDNPTVSFFSLPPGDFKLRMKVTNKAGFWDVPEKVLHIHVTGPIWRQWWFISSCFLLAMLLAYGINQYRFAQFKKIQAIRNRISKDLHDDIGSTLSSISMVSTAATKTEQPDTKEMIHTLQHIGENARSAMENMSDIVWAINPVNDSLKSVMDRMQIFASKILEAQNIKLILHFPQILYPVKLEMQQRKNIYLILREAILNTAKYSQATVCEIIASKHENEITLQINDNGIGFENIVGSLGGNGLINMKHRAEELNGSFHIDSSKGNGTSIALQFNYK